MNNHMITGADFVTRRLHKFGITRCYAYPGTSELALCNHIDEHPSLSLYNARGDKECLFFAAGANLLGSICSCAIVHGARGLTNSLGAAGSITRNEIPLLTIVGLPSTTSQNFLPPHGEKNLVDKAGAFFKSALDTSFSPISTNQNSFFNEIESHLRNLSSLPYGPVLIGLPQDILETRWIDEVHANEFIDGVSTEIEASSEQIDLSCAAKKINCSKNILILIDDYYLKYEASVSNLKAFSRAIDGLVYQVKYRRGPMLFQSLHNARIKHFRGWIGDDSIEYNISLESADLIITIEDRNMYPRVVGAFPDKPVLVINSDCRKPQKNGYLNPKDIILEGNPSTLLNGLMPLLVERKTERKTQLPQEEHNSQQPNSQREIFISGFFKFLHTLKTPIIVDDSQMLGGLLNEYPSAMPRVAKVIGDHSGFVGAGISYSVGVAMKSGNDVVCLVGDQGFVNGFQGLLLAVEQNVNMLFIVCNNGASVSLNKQNRKLASKRNKSYLSNVNEISYHLISESIGLESDRLSLNNIDTEVQLLNSLTSLNKHTGPKLLEIEFPDDDRFWINVWKTDGQESTVETQA